MKLLVLVFITIWTWQACSSKPADNSNTRSDVQPESCLYHAIFILGFSSKFLLCEGAMINEDYVITAAACLDKYKSFPDKIQVAIGARTTDDIDSNDNVQRRTVSNIEFPPEWFASNKQRGDIAVAKLSKPIEENSYVCSAKYGKNVTVNAIHKLIGYGNKEQLAAVPLKVESEEKASDSFKGTTENKNEDLASFAGAPVTDDDSPNYIHAIASGRKSGVFTKISIYKDWIKNKTKSDGDDDDDDDEDDEDMVESSGNAKNAAGTTTTAQPTSTAPSTKSIPESESDESDEFEEETSSELSDSDEAATTTAPTESTTDEEEESTEYPESSEESTTLPTTTNTEPSDETSDDESEEDEISTTTSVSTTKEEEETEEPSEESSESTTASSTATADSDESTPEFSDESLESSEEESSSTSSSSTTQSHSTTRVPTSTSSGSTSHASSTAKPHSTSAASTTAPPHSTSTAASTAPPTSSTTNTPNPSTTESYEDEYDYDDETTKKANELDPSFDMNSDPQTDTRPSAQEEHVSRNSAKTHNSSSSLLPVWMSKVGSIFGSMKQLKKFLMA